jgi:hypothetical protein
MTDLMRTKLDWMVAVAAAVGAPLAILFAACAKDIADALGHIGDGSLLALAAAANALTLVP